MVYAELALRWQQFHIAPAMQQPDSTVRTPLQWILKICAVKKDAVSRSESRGVSTVSAQEQRIVLCENNQQ